MGCTAAFDRRRQEKPPSFLNSRPPCLCQGQDRQCVCVRRDPVPGSNISRFPVRFNAETCADCDFLGQKCDFSRPVQVCCTSFAGNRHLFRIGLPHGKKGSRPFSFIGHTCHSPVLSPDTANPHWNLVLSPDTANPHWNLFPKNSGSPP